MAGSRLDRVGTIFSRTTGLIKAGAITYQERPVWYDVYRIFPPKYEPRVDREAIKTEVQDILYKEDQFRAKFFKKFGLNPGGIPRKFGNRNFQEPSQPFVELCLDLLKRNPELDNNQIFDRTLEDYKHQIPKQLSRSQQGDERETEVIEEARAAQRHVHVRKSSAITAESLLSLFKEAKEQQALKEDAKSPESNKE